MTEQQKKLRILFNSNAMWSSSGYGQQTQELLPHIRDAGYPIAASNFFGQSGGKFMLDGIMQYPVINHTYGSDAMILHARDFNANVVFTLQDAWVLNPVDLQQVPRWIPWVPIDHDPVSRPVLDVLRYAYRIVTYSKYGQKQLADNGLSATYIPHTVNTDIFTPMNKPQRKQETGLPPDSFLIGMVAANKDNPPRKSFQEVIDAFKLFLEKEPKALLYIHSNPEFPGGFNFKHYADYVGVGNKLLMPENYAMNFNTSKEDMAKIYNTFDVLVAPSISEGFGIPIIEAQSVGVPVIVNNFTSMPELVVQGITGEICDLIKGPSGKRFSPQGSYMGIPDTLSLFDNMMKIYRADRGKMKDAARKHIEANYATKKVFTTLWMPYLEKLEKEIYPT
jgi:glycosyltransferase involved in cell wall biosynthesis